MVVSDAKFCTRLICRPVIAMDVLKYKPLLRVYLSAGPVLFPYQSGRAQICAAGLKVHRSMASTLAATGASLRAAALIDGRSSGVNLPH